MTVEQRLTTCFSKVFPGCPEDRFPLASPETVPQWDSIATITLLQVIEDEFGTPLDLEDLDKLSSFTAIVEYLRPRVANS